VIARNHLPVSGTAGVTDMRKGFAALAAQTGQTTAQNPFSHCPPLAHVDMRCRATGR